MAKQEGVSTPYPLETKGHPESQTFFNLSWEELKDHAVARGQGFQIRYEDAYGEHDGAFSFVTEKNKRSAQDKYYVKTPGTAGKIWEKINKPLSSDNYNTIVTDVGEYLSASDTYVQDVALGLPSAPDEDPLLQTRIRFRFITNSPAHAMFANILFDRLTPEEIEDARQNSYQPDMTVYHAPDFHSDPERHGTDATTTTKGTTTIAADYEHGTAVILGTDYSGELKKFGLTLANEFAARINESIEARVQVEHPEWGMDQAFDTVAVMHGSIYQKADGTAVLIKGGSGAGKSSALPEPGNEELARGERKVGDDQIIVRMMNGVTTVENPEGGAYLTSANFPNEPHFAAAAVKKGSMLENVVVDSVTKRPDFSDISITKNARAAIPMTSLNGYSETGRTGELSAVTFIIPDARGVLSPIMRTVDPMQTLLWGDTGLGADMPDRASGVADVRESFVSQYMNPFATREPKEVLNAHHRIYKANNTRGYIVNSGWRGGPYGVGERPPVEYTQAAVKAIVRDELNDAVWSFDPVLGVEYLAREGNEQLDPRILAEDNTWADPAEQQKQKLILAKLIRDNFYATHPEGSHPLRDELEKWLPQLPSEAYMGELVFHRTTHKVPR